MQLYVHGNISFVFFHCAAPERNSALTGGSGEAGRLTSGLGWAWPLVGVA